MEKPALWCQGKVSAKRAKGGGWMLKPSPGILCLQNFRNIRVGPCATLLSSVTLNDLETNLELDSHADTSCLGVCALVLTDYESPVYVQGYEPALGTKTYHTTGEPFLYDHPYTGRTYHIVIHQAVEIPDLKYHLLWPMQVRTNSITVNDCPIFLNEHLNEETHAIIADDEWGNKLVLPLCLSGVISYLPVCLLAENKWNRRDTLQINLTNRHLTWDQN